ncbi:MAG: 6,7-dimethyl-8-ribityllumazine synthase [Coxiella sp. RIFCSPHIGHO2_12_FULL_42_15]|nr:MAG: 6,7-dimethyl-8-ribityllumazine synthase [Coxiella sp. RIFCSPHIGHO2_12_FULL_42_15]
MKHLNFAIVVSRFNETITEKLLEGALQRFAERKIPTKNIAVWHVPGAIELPIIAQQLAKQRRYQAILCLGAVVRGETDHYDYVCQQVSYGCQRVALDHDIPVIFGLLTTDNEEQAFDRVGGRHGHKGSDCADTAIEMADCIEMLISSSKQ